jgi:serine/threonine protein phosphatase PrpC
MWSPIQRLTHWRSRQQPVREAKDLRVTDPEILARPRAVTLPTSLGALTDVGRKRDHNEDAFYVSPDGRLLIVADGMGGYESGEVASALAVEAVVEVFEKKRGKEPLTGSAAVEAALREAFQHAHQRILDEREKRERRLMGSTLIAACFDGPHLTTCHVGDVRGYVRSDAGLEQITRDHSVVGELVRTGYLEPAAARTHPRKNEVLQAIGVADPLEPEVNVRELRRGDLVLLCSDGLWGAVPDEEIAAILTEKGSVHERAARLIERANTAGGPDNITVILKAYEKETPQAVGPTVVTRQRKSRLLFSLLCLLLLAGAGLYFLRPLARETPPAATPVSPLPKQEMVSRVDPETRAHIDRWIAENDLNEYGDPKGTMYLGGTPLFDERTGQSRERYEYILEKHPELRQSEPGKEGKPDHAEKH